MLCFAKLAQVLETAQSGQLKGCMLGQKPLNVEIGATDHWPTSEVRDDDSR
jgi:hypothetical protein